MDARLLQVLIGQARQETGGRPQFPGPQQGAILNPWRNIQRPTLPSDDQQTLERLKVLLQQVRMQLLLKNTMEAVQSGTLPAQGVPGNGFQSPGGPFGSAPTPEEPNQGPPGGLPPLGP